MRRMMFLALLLSSALGCANVKPGAIDPHPEEDTFLMTLIRPYASNGDDR